MSLSLDHTSPAPLFMGWSNLLQGSGSTLPHRMHSHVPLHAARSPLPCKCLVLSVTTGIFNEIKSGAKVHEYRPYSNFWKRQLLGKSFTHIAIICGRKRISKNQKMMVFEWQGYEVKSIQQARSNQAGLEAVEVFAMRLTCPCDTLPG